MPDVSLAYGDTQLQADLPQRAQIVSGASGEIAGRLPPLADEALAVREALTHPLGTPRISELLKPASTVLIGFDDPTVVSYGPFRRLAIEAVLEDVRSAGVPDANVRLVCANALHRKWTREELASVLGQPLLDRFGDSLTCHDAEDPENLVRLGTTPGGYDVEVNRLVVESDLTVYVNAQTHMGFSGGWKSVCVGLSTWRSIRWTHTPHGMTMSLRENRMHRVFDEMGAHLESALGRRIFKVETAMANPFQAAQVWAGGVDETRQAALAMLEGSYQPRRAAAQPADVVVYGVPNWSPYAMFSIMNPLLTLVSTGLGYLGGYIEALGKPGCSVIMATPCPDQWDLKHHAAYPEVWGRVLPETLDPYEISERFGEAFAACPEYIEQYRSEYSFHPIHAILATHPLKRLRHAARVFVAGAQDPAVPRHLGFLPTQTVEEAISEAEGFHGKDCSIVCLR